MNYSKITLFRNSKFYPNQNYKIDDIEDFLNSYLSEDRKVFDKQQYWKINGIIKEFKLDISQEDIKNIHEFNYAKVEMIAGDEVEFVEWKLYYFVVNFEWISRSTIKLTLRLDTLNTFLDTLQFHPKTFIEREHTDRWNYESYIKDDENQKITLLRNIPELNEGLNPQKYSYSFDKDYKFKLSTTYRNPITIYEKATSPGDQPIPATYLWGAVYIGNSDGETPKDLSFTMFISTEEFWVGYLYPETRPAEKTTEMYNIPLENPDLIRVMLIPYSPHNVLRDLSQHTQENPFVGEGLIKSYRFRLSGEEEKYLIGVRTDPSNEGYYDEDYNQVEISQLFETCFNDWSGRGPRYFVEIFKYLFCSIDINYSELLESIKDNGFFRMNGYSNESSLYSGEFLELNFSFGENSYALHLEDYKYNGEYSLEEMFEPNSRNLFIRIMYSISLRPDSIIFFRFVSNYSEFSSYEDGAFDYESSKPRGELMICPISSQIPLLSSEYLNYMRNGYNYDIKLRDLGRQQRNIDLGIKAAGTVATIGLGIATGGLGGALLGGKAIKGATGIITGAVNNYYETMREDLEMEKKLAELKGSKLGVEQINGGIDKMTQINIPMKLSLSLMAPKKSWWKYLEDYFYYFGNKSQYYGIPTHNNRCLFDYLKCKAEFVNKNSLPTQEALSDIITRLNIGVVFVHKFMNQWTFDSDYKENLEVALYNIINPTNKNKKKRS